MIVINTSNNVTSEFFSLIDKLPNATLEQIYFKIGSELQDREMTSNETMLELKSFESGGLECSIYKKIPIQKYNEQFRKMIRKVVGQPVRFKFRGPRPAKYGRGQVARQGTCLKEDATTFAIYLR